MAFNQYTSPSYTRFPSKKLFSVSGIKNSFDNYLVLCKPKVISLMLVTVWVGMLLAAEDFISFKIFVLTTLGIGSSGASAAIFNHLIDRKIDSKMHRTAKRPLVTGNISNKQALYFALLLGVWGLGVLYYFINSLTALLTFLTFIGYAVIYSIFLKHNTPQNIVIGGIAGAMPPLLGWTAITNEMNTLPILLVMIIFIWTPPHFWSLAIYRFEDYQKANVPMLPVTHGMAMTQLFILLYTILLFIISLIPFLIALTGLLYLTVSFTVGVLFLYFAIKLYRINSAENIRNLKKTARNTFKFSIIYLVILFISILLDHNFKFLF